MKDLGSKARQGILWTSLFNFVQYCVRIVSSIILARILFPEDFGLMGIALITIQFAETFSSFGFNSALIQREEVDDKHVYTVFVFNLLLMSLSGMIVFLISPLAATFFEHNRVELILKVLSIKFIMKGFTGVPEAILKRELRFKEVNIILANKHMASYVSSVVLALMGFGVWSLVFGHMCAGLIDITLCYYYTRWVPRFIFSKTALKDVFSFGIFLHINNYIKYFINNVDYFFIGKLLSATQLGYYERAFNLMSIPRKEVMRRINEVLFSAYSRIQTDNARIISALMRVLNFISLITFPVMIWLFFAAPSFVTVVYGAKWSSTIYPLQIMCISGLLNTFTVIFYPILNAKGLVSQSASRNFIYLIILTIAVYIGITWGINGVAWGVAGASFFWFALYIMLMKKYTDFTLRHFFKAQKSALIYSSIQISTLIVFQLIFKQYFSITSWQMLLGISFFSVVSFLGSHFIFKFEDVRYLFSDVSHEVKVFLNAIPVVNRLVSTPKKI